MASRGISPSFPATGGATGTSSQAIDDTNEDSNNLELKYLTSKIDSSMDYKQKSESILEFWTSVSKLSGSVTKREHLLDEIRKCIRSHQEHVIDPLWCEQTQETKSSIYNALKAAENIVKDNTINFKEFEYLQATHFNAWTGKEVQPILSGKPDFKSTDYFHLECPRVCMKRLLVLVETRLDLMAFNLTDFLVKNIFDTIKRRNNVFLVKWIDSATSFITNKILDVYLTLMFKLKKDSILLHPTLKLLSIEEVVSAIDRWSKRGNNLENEDTHIVKSSDIFAKLYTKPMCSKIEIAICDFSMIYAAKCELELEIIQRIVSMWLRLFPDGNDSNLDIEVEKYVSLGGKTAQIYEIGYQIYAKFGECRRQLYVEQLIRGLHYDLNVKEVALMRKDHQALKRAEQSISSGLQYLARVMHSQLAVVRESLLSAFSLTPTRELLKEIKKVAEKSGFIPDPNESPDTMLGGELDKIKDFQAMDFDAEVDSFISSLEQGNYMRTSYCGRLKDKKRTRNLDALISIQGNLVTEAANYDPVSLPLSSFTAQKLNLHPRTVADLLICINSPRWHLLSWVMDWPSLEQKCKELLENPDIRKQDSELKYLVIDYTQFDDWSSEEDMLEHQNYGIEKGYEEWDKYSSGDDQPIEERGLEDDEDIQDFNVMPKLLNEQGQEDEDEFFDDYIEPKDYLPKRLNPAGSEIEPSKYDNSKLPAEGLISTPKDEHFLAKMEEVADVPATQEDNKIASAVNLLQDNNGGTSVNDVAGQMTREKEQPTYNLICNTLEITSKSSPHSLGKKDQVKWLQRNVPGLDGDLSYLSGPFQTEGGKSEMVMDIYVVHVKTSNAKNVSSNSIQVQPSSSQVSTANGLDSISSPSSSNPSSPTKSNGVSPAPAKKLREKSTPQKFSQVVLSKNLDPSTSNASEGNASAKSSSPTKTPTKSKRRAATNKSSPSPTTSKNSTSRAKVSSVEKKDPQEESVQQNHITSNKANSTVTLVRNNTTPMAHQPNILTLQPSPLANQLPQNPVVTKASQQSLSPLKDQSTRERKVQYIYKQGGQTVIIDYPMAEDTLARLKPVPVMQQGQPSHQQQIRLPIVLANAAGVSPQKIITQRQTQSIGGNQNATAIVLPTTPPKIILSAAQSPSVDTLANSLISQIQTPLNPTDGLSQGNAPSTQKIQQVSSSPSSSVSTLPKFQFAFGGSKVNRPNQSLSTNPMQNNTGIEAQGPLIKTENGSIVASGSQHQISSNNSGQQIVMKQVTLPLPSASSSQVLGTTGHVIQLQKAPADIINGKIILTQSSPQGTQMKQNIQSPQRCIVQAVSGGSGGVTISKPQPTQINAIIQKLTPVTTVQQQLANKGRSPIAVLSQGTSSSVPVMSQGSVANSVSSMSSPTTASSPISSTNTNQVDLIRQLNMARAQGLVILQQWGDKQVLVHKATGRWIMRQGNRLVTVPPQALGITSPGISSNGTSGLQKQPTTVITPGSPSKQWIQTNIGGRTVSQAVGAPTVISTGSPSKPVSQLLARLTSGGQIGKQDQIQVNLPNQKPEMSSSTMEQLAEFDSILESKFKSFSPPPSEQPQVAKETTSIKTLPPIKIENNSQNLDQSVSRPQSTATSGPTFVILQPSNTSAKTSVSSSVVVTSATSTSSIPNKIQPGNKGMSEPVNSHQIEKMSSTSSTSSRGSCNRSPSPLPLGTTKTNANGIRILSTSAPSSPAKNTSTPPVTLNQSCSSASASPASSTSSSVSSNFMKPPPKPQEDPDTLKRIQQILDDYNEQIRNSPDLQNRPAPRRRTNGVPNTTGSSTYSPAASSNTSSPSMSPISTNASNNNPTSTAKKKRSNAGLGCKSDSETDTTVVQISPANAIDQGQIPGPQKSVSKITTANDSQSVTPVAPPPNLKPIVRQIMVPPSLAASLQASGRQLMVVTGPGGKKMVALKPLLLSQSNGSSNKGNTSIRIQTPSMSTLKQSSTSVASSISVGPPGASVAVEADDYHHGQNPDDEEEGNATAMNAGSSSSQSGSPCSVVSSQSITLNSTGNQYSATSESPMSSNNQSLPPSPLENKISDTLSLTSKVDSGHLPSPPPISLGLEMPLDTQSMGIPIEMTPGQIMEAEMSASGSLLDDEVVAGSASMSMNEFFNSSAGNSPTHRLRSTRCSLGSSDHDTLSHAEQETLPENVFNHDFLSDDQMPSPKLEKAPSSSNNSNVIGTSLSNFEANAEPASGKIGGEFSLDGIVCSIGDEIGNIEGSSFGENGFDSEINDVNIGNEEKEKIEDQARNVLNNNKSRQPQNLFSKVRKRKASSGIDNEKDFEQELSEPSSSAKKARLKRENEELDSRSFVPSTMRTRNRRSLALNRNSEENNEGAIISPSFDFNEGEDSSLISESLSTMASSVSLISPFAGIPTTASPTVASVGDFDL